MEELQEQPILLCRDCKVRVLDPIDRSHSIDNPISLSSLPWSILRQIVLRRDGYQCQCKCTSILGIRCSSGIKRLEVHHINPNRHRKLGGIEDIDNLITLCTRCHKIIQSRLRNKNNQ